MLHVRDVKVEPKGEIDDRVWVRLIIEGLATERAVDRLKETVELHYRNRHIAINGDASIPIADLIEILERNSDVSDGRG